MTTTTERTISFFSPFFVADDPSEGKSPLKQFQHEIEEAAAAGVEDLTILINSPGGEVACLHTMLDLIYDFPGHVTTVATGMAASCGFMLLLAGDSRKAYSTAALMSHQFSSGSRGKYHELLSSVEHFNHLDKWMMKHYTLHTGLSEADVRKHLLHQSDVWLTAEQALKLGVIDEVLYPARPIGKVARDKANKEARKREIALAREVIKALQAGE